MTVDFQTSISALGVIGSRRACRSDEIPSVIPADASPETDEGIYHRLDPAWIELQRLVGWIACAVLAPLLLLGVLIALFVGSLSFDVKILLSLAWVAVALLLAWLAQAWPDIEYRRTSYAVDAEHIEIRRGVIWRVVTSVPKSRVQHIDVAQGPLERRYGLATLSIYTAGTEYARVDLPGLRHERAVAIRDHLLPGHDRDAGDGT
jgi:membrane protein YdbS with pleckstrin-like domain